MQDKTWTRVNERHTVSNSSVEMERIIVLMAIAKGRGVVAWLQTTEHVNSAVFCQLIRRVSQVMPQAAILMDNVAYHKSRESLMEAGRQNVYPILSVPYSPQLNPIELVFAQLKKHYRALRLE